MIKVDGKKVSECGWAGPLLWICTTDRHSVHLYDAPIKLNGKRIRRPDDVDTKLAGQRIRNVLAGKKNFRSAFDTGDVLEVARSTVETARVFKRHGLSTHWIYKGGVLRKDA